MIAHKRTVSILFLDGQSFGVRVRNDGYRAASQSFRFAYSVWDYGDALVNIELLRN